MKHLIYPALLGLALAGCSQERGKTELDTAPETPVSPAVITQAPTPVVAVATPPVVARQLDHDIVYQGELNLAVDSFEQVSASVNRLLVQHDSYLATAHEERANGQQRQEMTIKVPPKEFASLVAALSRLGHVENKDIASTDITADLLQATASLETKKAAVAKYQQLARSASPAEARRLDEQTQQLRADLVADQARLQQLGARSAWATLTLRFYQVLPVPEPTVPVPAFAPQFSAAFYRGWSLVLSILVTLTNFWPLGLLGAVGAWVVRRWQRRQAAEL